MSPDKTHRVPVDSAPSGFEIEAPQGPVQHGVALGSAVALLIYAAVARPRWLRTALALTGVGFAVHPLAGRDDPAAHGVTEA